MNGSNQLKDYMKCFFGQVNFGCHVDCDVLYVIEPVVLVCFLELWEVIANMAHCEESLCTFQKCELGEAATICIQESRVMFNFSKGHGAPHNQFPQGRMVPGPKFQSASLPHSSCWGTQDGLQNLLKKFDFSSNIASSKKINYPAQTLWSTVTVFFWDLSDLNARIWMYNDVYRDTEAY